MQNVQTTQPAAFKFNMKPRSYTAGLCLLAALNFATLLTVAGNRNSATAPAPVQAPPAMVQAAAYPLTDTECEQWAHRMQQEQEREARMYKVEMQEDFAVIYADDRSGRRVVGTLTYRTTLGQMLLNDNR